MILLATILLACGYPVPTIDGVLRPPPELLVDLGGEPLDYAVDYAEPFRFLDPFVAAGLPWAKGLAHDAYGFEDPAPLVLPAWKPDAAVARATIDALLGAPSPVASHHAEELRRAVEFLDLGGRAPGAAEVELRTLSRDRFEAWLAAHPSSPRAATVALAVAADHVTKRLPEGWIDDAPTKVTDDTWRALVDEHERWIAAHRTHPLVDLARLQLLHVHFRHADGARTWAMLVDLYKRRPVRAAWEMRYVVRNRLLPPINLIVATAKHDLTLAAAMLPLDARDDVSETQWNALWRASERDPAKGLTLQTRLLWRTRSGKLPRSFPSFAAVPSEHWAWLRTFALIAARRAPEAAAQAALIADTKWTDVARTAARAFALTGDWEHVLAIRALPDDDAAYVLHVLVDNASLERFAVSGPRANLAALALATRRLGDDAWEAGSARLAAIDPDRAALWHEAATLAANHSTEGLLTFARWLSARPGRLFLDLPRQGTRSWKNRYEHLLEPAAPFELRPDGERAQLEAFFLRGGERQRALELYAAALAQHRTAALVAEADAAYSAVVDRAYSEAHTRLIDRSAVVQSLRHPGKRQE